MLPPPESHSKLINEKNIWIASVRADGRPHLVPVWFTWHSGKIYLSIDPKSVKSRNVSLNPNVVLALEDGSHPVICEGLASPVLPPLPEEVIRLFKRNMAGISPQKSSTPSCWKFIRLSGWPGRIGKFSLISRMDNESQCRRQIECWEQDFGFF
jgi:F420H(2)-dependent biliverdin reductase